MQILWFVIGVVFGSVVVGIALSLLFARRGGSGRRLRIASDLAREGLQRDADEVVVVDEEEEVNTTYISIRRRQVNRER